MDYLKTTVRVAVALVVVGAFVEIPYAGTIIAVLGLAAGLQRSADGLVAGLVTAIALSIVAGALDSIPAVGTYITAILGGLAGLAAADAVGRILMATYKEVGP